MTRPKNLNALTRNLYPECGHVTHHGKACAHPGTKKDSKCWFHSAYAKPRPVSRQKMAAEVRKRMLEALDKASRCEYVSDSYLRYVNTAVEAFVELRQLSAKPRSTKKVAHSGHTLKSAMSAFLSNNKGA